MSGRVDRGFGVLLGRKVDRRDRTTGLHLRRLRLEPLEDRRLLATNVLRVDVDCVAAVPDGASWPSAYVSLQDALDRAAALNADGDAANNVAQIWIAEGTYRPTKLSDADLDGTIDTDPRSATFSLLGGVSLYGGFAGTESTLGEREPAVDGVFPHETILSGDLGQNDAPNIATANLISDPSRQENAYTVVTVGNLTQLATLDGLTITGGNANGLTISPSSPSRSGGGIHNSSPGGLTVSSTTVSGNSARPYGGGIYNSSSTLTVNNATISDNFAGSGGGIYNSSGTLTATNATISGNSAGSGGGIYNSSGTMTVANATISDNSANDSMAWGGGIYNAGASTIADSTISDNSANGSMLALGGGICNVSGTLTITNTTISGNSAKTGGGIDMADGTLTITNATISGNSADYGGGVYMAANVLAITNTIISGNSASGGGGGIRVAFGTSTVTNSTISGNSATKGGGIDNYSATLTVANSTISGNSAGGDGGGILNDYSATLTLVTSTISGNWAVTTGGGIDNSGMSTVANSTISGNSANDGGGIDSHGTLTATHSILAKNLSPTFPDIRGGVTAESNYDLIGIWPGGSPPGENSLWGTPSSPLDPDLKPLGDYGGATWTMPLLPRSLAIDAGDFGIVDPTATDQRGSQRIVDGDYDGTARIDIGAFEYVPGEVFSPTEVLRVDVDSVAAAPDGASWSSAYVSLQDALDRAALLNSDGNAENNVAQIWIAEGTYIPTALSDADGNGVIDTNPRSATFSLVDGVSLYGGFAGTESTLGEREPAIGGVFPHATILSGDLGQNDASNIATANLRGNATRQENAYTVVTARNLAQPTILDGLTITGGNANVSSGSTSNPNHSGGGIYSRGSDTLIVANSMVSGNSADYGGAVYNYSGTLSVASSTISGNLANEAGGGIYKNSGTLTVTNATIADNLARSSAGGGIASSSGTMTVANSTISSNSASDGGGIYSGFGGATVANSTISGNLATFDGGGIRSYGTMTVSSSTISGNLANRNGGGIYKSGSGALTVINSIVALNEAPLDPNISGPMALGGGFNLLDVDPAFVRSPSPGADATWGTADDDAGDLHLTQRSPAVNSGNNASLPVGLTVDIDGNSRVFGGRTDIGAYELQADPLPGREPPSTIVTTVADSLDLYDGLVSLREAVWYGASVGNTITFDGSLDGTEIVLAGSAIHLDHSLTIDGSDLGLLTINADHRSRVFTVYAADVHLIGLTISGGNTQNGGGIYNCAGTLTVTSSTVSGNSADYSGGGIYNYTSTTLIIASSTISDNSANHSGGGIYSDYDILSVTSSTISDNSASTGGGIYSFSGTLTVTSSTVSGNSAHGYEGGGGIYIASGSATVTDSTISGNSSNTSGGGIYNSGGRSTVRLTVASSTIAGNSANEDGGGIYNDMGMLTVANSTISSNSTNRYGGGIYNSRTLTVVNSTISGNSANEYGGGIYVAYYSLSLNNTIVAENVAANSPDIYGYLAEESDFNLIGIWTGVPLPGENSLIGTPTSPLDPGLGPLGDYGGPTWTMPLLPGSPAIDAGNPRIVAPPATDQRGSQRIVDGNYDGLTRIDIGAFEYLPERNTVLARFVFYNNSIFDGYDPLAGAADAAAIAVDKTPLMPWQTASFTNYTSYEKGINGIVVDIMAGLPLESLTAADFEFMVGNSNDLATWTVAPAPQSIDVFPGMGQDGSNRVTIVWPDGAIRNQWLRVALKVNANTRLLEDDVFYFGNAVGESGNARGNAIVNATDEIMARNFPHGALNPAAIDDPCDYNRDGLVNGTDQIIARGNQTNPLSMLRLITAPTAMNELIQNGGFETGTFTGWTAANVGPPQMDDWTVGPAGGGFFFDSAPHSGNYSAYNGFDGPEGQQYTLSQDVAVPADAASAMLVTHHRIRYGAGNEPPKSRTFRIEACDPAGGWSDVLYEEQIRITPAGMDFGWARRDFDLSAYAGQTFRIRFTEIIPESYTGPAILELDDISLTYVAAPPAGSKPSEALPAPQTSPAELNWLYELQQMNHRDAKRTSLAEAAVDALLATYG